MKRPNLSAPHLAFASACALLAAGCATTSPTPSPVPGGGLGTLPMGTYTCELPGAPGEASGKPLPDYEFRIVNASSYKNDGIRGSYLLTGDHLALTGGKLKGLNLQRISSTFLREVKADGTFGDMRCVLTSRR